MRAPVPSAAKTSPPRRPFAIAARLVLLAWLAFLTWFACAVMATEGVAAPPVLWLLVLWGLGATAWRWPHIGGPCLLGLAAVAAWYFGNAAGSVMVAAPAATAGVLFLLSRRAPSGQHAAAIAACLCLPASQGCAGTPLSPPDPPFRAASIERHAEGTIAKGWLDASATIGGMPCKGWVRLHPDGRLDSFELATATTIQGHNLPAATYVWLDDAGALRTCFLAEDTLLQGHLCRGGPWKIATSFHPGGALQAFFPRDEVTIDGVRCAASTQAPVVLHENGRLARCRLAAPFTVGGRTLGRGDTIELDPLGRLIGGS